MGIDRPDDADLPSDNSGDRTSAPGNDGQQSGASHVETRYREEYYYARRTQVTQEQRATTGARQEAPASDTWTETANLARWMWGEYHRRWPPEERPPSRQIHRPARLLAQRQQQIPRQLHQRPDRSRVRPYRRTRARKDLAQDTRCGEPRPNPPPHRLRAPPQRPRPHKGKSLRRPSMSSIALQSRPFRFFLTRSGTPSSTSRLVTPRRSSLDIMRLKEQGFALDMLKNSWSD